MLLLLYVQRLKHLLLLLEHLLLLLEHLLLLLEHLPLPLLLPEHLPLPLLQQRRRLRLQTFFLPQPVRVTPESSQHPQRLYSRGRPDMAH